MKELLNNFARIKTNLRWKLAKLKRNYRLWKAINSDDKLADMLALARILVRGRVTHETFYHQATPYELNNNLSEYSADFHYSTFDEDAIHDLWARF